MKKWLLRIREFFVFAFIVVAWRFFLCVAKIKWLFVGPKVLPVSLPEMTCAPDEAWCTKAELSDVSTFVERRMKNRLRKIAGANWEVLHEDAEAVYYGRPHTVFGAGGWFRSSEFGVDQWYRLPKAALVAAFPGYLEVDGCRVRRVLEEVFRAKPELQALRNQWQCRLEEDALVIFHREEGEALNLSAVRLDLTDGSVHGAGAASEEDPT